MAMRFSSPAHPEIGRLSPINNDFYVQHPSANAMNTEPWVTAEHFAQHLGVAKDTVYRWRKGNTARAPRRAIVEILVVRGG